MNNKDVILSKTLSKLLRHKAVEEGLHISSEGFVLMNQILEHKYLRGKYTLEDIKKVVNNNNKQRFCIRRNDTNGLLEIRANQGHSISVSSLLMFLH